MPDEHSTEPGYLKARVEMLGQQMTDLRTSTRENLQEIKTDISRQEERLKIAITDSERRAAERMEQLARSLAEQTHTLHEALRMDREQWVASLEKLQPMQKYIFMILGALVLLNLLARPLIDKVFKP